MTSTILTVCGYQGCTRLVTTRPCAEHRRERERHRNAQPTRAAHHTQLHYRIRRAILHGQPHCHLCGKPGADTVDYITPLARGGTMTLENAAPAHRSCNSRKGAQ